MRTLSLKNDIKFLSIKNLHRYLRPLWHRSWQTFFEKCLKLRQLPAFKPGKQSRGFNLQLIKCFLAVFARNNSEQSLKKANELAHRVN